MAISSEYQQWCDASGIKLHGIAAAFVEHGWRGVVATQDIQPGHVLLEVPEELLMTTRSARRDSTLRAALEGTPGLSDTQVLGAHLLRELSRCQAATTSAPAQAPPSSSAAGCGSGGCGHKGDGSTCGDGGSGSNSGSRSNLDSCTSRWRLYIEHLPRSYTTLCNWSDEEVEALQLEHAVEVAAAAVHEARQQWQQVLPMLRDLGLPRKYLGFQAWLWAASTLMSRTMFVPFDKAGALTPFGDLHNYVPPPPPFTPDILKGLPLPSRQQQQQQQQQLLQQEATMVPATPVDTQQPAESQASGSLSTSHALIAQDDSMQPNVEPTAASLRGDGGCEDSGERVQHPAEESQPSPSNAGSGTAGEGTTDDVTGAGAADVAKEGGDEGTEQTSGSTGGDGHFDEALGLYRLIARAHYAPGDQVFLCYGRHTNLELLQHYGFMLHDNPHEEVQVPLHLLDSQIGKARRGGGSKVAACGPLTAIMSASDCFLHANGQPSWELLRALRTLAEPAAERKRVGHLLAAGDRASHAGELRAVVWLRDACREYLEGLPTTLEQDQQMINAWSCAQDMPDGAPEQRTKSVLAATCPSLKLQLAVEWRTCQKRILTHGVRLCEDAISRLAALMPPDDADQILGHGRFQRHHTSRGSR